MPRLKITSIYPEDLDQENTFCIPECVSDIGSNLLFPFYSKDDTATSFRERIPKNIRVDIRYPIDYIAANAFSFASNYDIEIRITTKDVMRLRGDCFYGVRKLTIPSFTKAYKAKKVFRTRVGEVLTVEITDVGETYRFINAGSDNVAVVESEVDMKDGTLYSGYIFTGSFAPSKKKPVFVYFTEKDKLARFNYKASVKADDLASLKDELSALGLS